MVISVICLKWWNIYVLYVWYVGCIHNTIVQNILMCPALLLGSITQYLTGYNLYKMHNRIFIYVSFQVPEHVHITLRFPSSFWKDDTRPEQVFHFFGFLSAFRSSVESQISPIMFNPEWLIVSDTSAYVKHWSATDFSPRIFLTGPRLTSRVDVNFL